jgi:hypothetical protein
VTVHPAVVSIETLRDRAWEAIQPDYFARLAGLAEMFGAARSKELGGDDLAQTAKNAVAGRVRALLVEADRLVPGRIDLAAGEIELKDITDPQVDDLRDDLAELVLKNSGQVVIVPANQMPSSTGVAAILRF